MAWIAYGLVFKGYKEVCFMQTRKSRSDQWNPGNIIIQEIIQKYQQGISARQLGFEYDVADVTITSFLRRHNIFIRNRSNARRTNQIKEDVFDTITEESAYWIGFLLADGNVHHPPKRSKQLNLGLAARDWEHLEKFKEFVGSNKALYYYKNSVFLSIYSNRIAEKLAEYGIVPRKSKIAKVPSILKNNRHFWRGMVDGDGWVSPRPDGLTDIGLCGIPNIVSGFKRFIETKLWYIPVPDIKPYRKLHYFWEIHYCGAYVHNILSELYLTSHIFLERKKLLANGV